MLTDVVADAVTADVDVVSEITVVSGLFFCSSAVADVATASDTVATVVAEAVMTTVSGLFFCLSAVVDAAMALAAAKLPSFCRSIHLTLCGDIFSYPRIYIVRLYLQAVCYGKTTDLSDDSTGYTRNHAGTSAHETDAALYSCQYAWYACCVYQVY